VKGQKSGIFVRRDVYPLVILVGLSSFNTLRVEAIPFRIVVNFRLAQVDSLPERPYGLNRGDRRH